MENPPPVYVSTTRTALKYGFYTAVACIVVGIMFSLLFNAQGESGMTIFILCIGITYGMLDFRRANADRMTYMQCFNLGMIVSVVSGLCLGLLSAISISLLSAKDLAKVKDMYLHQFEVQGLAERELEAMKPMLDFVFSPTGAFIGTTLVWAFLGLIVTLVSGLFMRRGGRVEG